MVEILRHEISEFANRREIAAMEHPELWAERFNTPERYFATSWQRKTPETYDCLVRAGFFSGTVLDCATGAAWGPGYVSRLPQLKKIYALDMSRLRIEEWAPQILKMHKADETKVVLCVGDFYAMKFGDDFFDEVHIVHAIHHASDIPRVLRECRRVCKPGGRVIVVTQVCPGWRLPIRENWAPANKKLGIHDELYTMAEHRGFFAAAGFDAVRAFPLWLFPGVRQFVKRYTPLRWLNGRWFATTQVFVGEVRK